MKICKSQINKIVKYKKNPKPNLEDNLLLLIAHELLKSPLILIYFTIKSVKISWIKLIDKIVFIKIPIQFDKKRHQHCQCQ